MSAIDDYPRELSLSQRRGKWVLRFHAPDCHGEAVSSSRAVVAGIAEAYAAMRRDQGEHVMGDLTTHPGRIIWEAPNEAELSVLVTGDCLWLVSRPADGHRDGVSVQVPLAAVPEVAAAIVQAMCEALARGEASRG